MSPAAAARRWGAAGRRLRAASGRAFDDTLRDVERLAKLEEDRKAIFARLHALARSPKRRASTTARRKAAARAGGAA